MPETFTEEDQRELDRARTIIRGVVKEMLAHGFRNSTIYAALADTVAALLINNVHDIKQRASLMGMLLDLVLSDNMPPNGERN